MTRESIISLAAKRKQKAMEEAEDRLVDYGGALIDELTGCWLWKGDIDEDGYARLKGEPAHRTVFVLVQGPLPDGVQVDHLCKRRACVRPAHLDPVTHEENQMRRAGHFPVRCPTGHFMPPGKAGRTPEGGVFCRQCVPPIALEKPVLDWLDELFGV